MQTLCSKHPSVTSKRLAAGLVLELLTKSRANLALLKVQLHRQAEPGCPVMGWAVYVRMFKEAEAVAACHDSKVDRRAELCQFVVK